MNIHNFYSDIVLSVRPLLDNYIFRNTNVIKRYEFNIGNRTFQITKDYSPDFQFPVAIINLNDDMPAFGDRWENIQGLTNYNTINETYVLYNESNDVALIVREEPHIIPITITINCESQLQAKEYANAIRRMLPINKYIQINSFTSFLEMDNIFIREDLFYPRSHRIHNLYTKLNSKSGNINYMFSINYDPLIRLDAVSAAIPDSTQRSFQCTAEISYLVPFPIYIFSNKEPDVPIRINLVYSQMYEPISDYPIQKLITSNDLTHKCIRRNLLVYSKDEHEFIDDPIKYKDKIYLKIKFDRTDFIIEQFYEYNFYSKKKKIIKYPPFQISPSENYVMFEFTRDLFNNFFNPSLTSPIVIQFVDPRKDCHTLPVIVDDPTTEDIIEKSDFLDELNKLFVK